MTGRPPIEFDLDDLEKLAGLQCTQSEIAAFFNCSEDTITRRMHEDADFADAFKRGRERGKQSLRKWQFEAAKKGNVAMMIFLGKNYLGQTDDTKLRALEERMSALEGKHGS